MMKGVSPLIAAVLLIVIVVSIVAILSGWLTTFFVSTSETVTNRTDTSVGCSGALMSVESVYLTSGNTTASVNVAVANVGSVDGLSIISAHVYNSTGSNFSSATTLPITGFSRGAVRTLHFENMSIPSCAAYSRVIVTTQCATTVHKTSPDNC